MIVNWTIAYSGRSALKMAFAEAASTELNPTNLSATEHEKALQQLEKEKTGQL